MGKHGPTIIVTGDPLELGLFIFGRRTVAKVKLSGDPSAIAKLSPEHKQVILLREVEGLAYEEIAATVPCSLGTVMSRLFYARKKLQEMLKDAYENAL